MSETTYSNSLAPLDGVLYQDLASIITGHAIVTAMLIATMLTAGDELCGHRDECHTRALGQRFSPLSDHLAASNALSAISRSSA